MKRTIEEILEDVRLKAHNDGCQSWEVICKLAMEEAIKEKMEEVVEQLRYLSDDYKVFYEHKIVLKTDLDDHIDALESFGSRW